MSRYRFALRPRWVVSHLVVLALVVAMVGACFWQIDRLQQKKDRNARVRARSGEPVVAVESLVAPGEGGRAAMLEFRRVTATGTYRADQEVLVRSRSRDGAPGSWVLTPLALPGGDEVLVNRGWIGNSGQLEAVPAAFTAPDGAVTVTGLIRRPETRGSFGPQDPADGTLSNFARADVARIDQQLPEELLPVYVQLEAQRPVLTEADPVPVPIPALDEGPHLAYAVQWAIFTTVALVGYPLILRRRARELEKEARTGSLDGPDPDDVPFPGDPRLDPAPAGGTTDPG